MKQPSEVLSPRVVVEALSSAALRTGITTLEQRALLQAAESEQKRAARREQPILELPAAATQQELRRARRGRAVRRGKDVFLPTWQDLCTAMPNALLRSALWSVRATRHGQGNELSQPGADQEHGTPIPTVGDVLLVNRGPCLYAHDRRVFAVCLDYYKDDRPLSGSDDAAWIEESFFKFIQRLGSKYHVDGHRAVQASLERLSAMSLHVRHNGLELPLPRVLEVSFPDDEPRSERPKSSDRLHFRVLAPFAALYGSAKWTAVPHAALDAGTGLKSWLASYYSTHSRPFETKLVELHRITGSAATFTKFKGQLRDALDSLKSAEQPIKIRIDRYETDAKEFMDAKAITVHMAAWDMRSPGKDAASS